MSGCVPRSRNHSVQPHFLNKVIVQFHRKQTLAELLLINTSLSEEGGVILVQALAKGNTTLTKLNLSGNNLSSKAAGAIGALLESNHSLKDLNLSWNNIKAMIKGFSFDAPCPSRLMEQHTLQRG